MKDVRRFTLELSVVENSTVVHRSHVFADGPILGVHVSTYHDGDPNRAMHLTAMMPWKDVEQIAAYVAGDGRDSQRVALSDGILRGFQKPSEMLIYRGGPAAQAKESDE